MGAGSGLMALSLDTELEVAEPLHLLASVETARRLRATQDTVMTISFLRLHEGVPFCYTRVHLPAETGRELAALPEAAALAEPGARTTATVISLVDRLIEHPVHSAVQDITAVAATAGTAHRPGVPVLRIERLYRDRELLPVELAVNRFHPDRYSYRLQLQGR